MPLISAMNSFGQLQKSSGKGCTQSSKGTEVLVVLLIEDLGPNQGRERHGGLLEVDLLQPLVEGTSTS